MVFVQIFISFQILLCRGGRSSWMKTIVSINNNVSTSYWIRNLQLSYITDIVFRYNFNQVNQIMLSLFLIIEILYLILVYHPMTSWKKMHGLKIPGPLLYLIKCSYLQNVILLFAQQLSDSFIGNFLKQSRASLYYRFPTVLVLLVNLIFYQQYFQLRFL